MKKIAIIPMMVLAFSSGAFAGNALEQLKTAPKNEAAAVSAAETKAAGADAQTPALEPTVIPMTCAKEAIAVAKANLDLKAMAYGFIGSTILSESLTLESTSARGALTFSVMGEIYKGSYKIKMVMDCICGIESIQLTAIED
jgi:hypothetical protein